MQQGVYNKVFAGVTLTLLALNLCGGEAGAGGRQLFFRVLGSSSNAPLLPKTRSVYAPCGSPVTATTGMADEGFTEFPHCKGRVDFCFQENYAIYPRIISGALMDPDRINTADIVVDHVYEPDGCVWGLSGRTFVQTFTATQKELVSVTLLVASEPGLFYAAVTEGGPGGAIIGPIKTFTSGHSMTWGWARWGAGEVPLQPGKSYGIRLWRADGKPWSPYLHATGDAYSGGILYVDGIAHPDSDLAVWILQEPPDLRRALVPGCDQNGWLYGVRRVTFVPKTPNVRLVWVNLSPVKEHCCDLVLFVRDASGKLLCRAKRVLACGKEGENRSGAFLFATNGLQVDPWTPYTAEVFVVQRGASPPSPAETPVARDIQLRVYGEPQPGALPAIYNLRTEFEGQSVLKLDWSVTRPAPVKIYTWGPGVNGNKTFSVPAGTTEFSIPKLWAGHIYRFKLEAIGPGGLLWRTPIYAVRMPRKDVKPIDQSPPYPEDFVTIAPPNLSEPPPTAPVRYRAVVEIENPDFEEGLKAWHCEPENSLRAIGPGSPGPEGRHGISTKWGRSFAGTSCFNPKERKQVLAVCTLTQEVQTVPGNLYLLAAMIRTVAPARSRGNTRVRFIGGPSGDPQKSQWYFTDGKWMRFVKRFRAVSTRSVIGFSFFRWYDIEPSGAYVDHVHLYDLGPAEKPYRCPQAVPPTQVPEARVVLADPRREAWEKVEAYLETPPGYVITGIGARAHYDNITTMWLRIQPLLPDGSLGPIEYMRGGWEPDAGLEAKIELPAGFVATGFGAGIAPEWDVKRLRVWARPLLPGGRFGPQKEFRGGIDLKSGVERQVRAPAGRVLVSAGLNCSLNDCNGIRAVSKALVRTATASASQEEGKK